MTDEIKAIRDALAVVRPLSAPVSAWLEYESACHPERIARLLDALEQASKDAERWRWLAENGSIGFEGAPGWRTVVHFDTFDMAANTLDAAIDAALKRGA